MPNVGKSTLFNALTDANALIANYPFATIEPNTGVVPIPDPRLEKLPHIYKTDRIVPAAVQFVDIAGLVTGASHGEGLGNQFLAHIRACNAVCHVVRVFENGGVARAGSTDPKINFIRSISFSMATSTNDCNLPGTIFIFLYITKLNTTNMPVTIKVNNRLLVIVNPPTLKISSAFRDISCIFTIIS